MDTVFSVRYKMNIRIKCRFYFDGFYPVVCTVRDKMVLY